MTKKYQTNHQKEHNKQQHCPTCNRYVKYNERYTNYVCLKCVNQATDRSGKQIVFYNITIDGHGCQGKYVENGKLYRGATCFIKGVKCLVDEAYLGGIIVRPLK